MNTHKLGGDWTETKLECVRKYASAWSIIMASMAKRYKWKTRYIDAFSGSGNYLPKSKSSKKRPSEIDDLFGEDPDKEKLRKGSALIAIEMEPKFDRIDLIELNPDFAEELRIKAGSELNKRVFVHEADANHALSELCKTMKSDERAIIFIDPYGCEVSWDTLKQTASTKVSDVWYLAPTSGVNR